VSATIRDLRATLTPELREDLIQVFEASLPERVSDILDAARSGDKIALRRAAHLLKGSAATLGAARLSLACRRLEQAGRDQDRDIEQDELNELRPTASETCQALRRQLLDA
jgi:HPt (histidine-containing phosphotransfer) domain-containing protein